MHFSHRYNSLLLPALLLTLVSNIGHAATELIDFGASGTQTIQGPTGTFWNNIPDTVATTALSPVILVDTNNMPTGITLLVTSRFNAANTNGTTASLLYPSTATSDSLFGNTAIFNGISVPNPTFTLSGLAVGTPYDFTFYASRIGAGGDIRTTDYFVTGSISGSTRLNASENVNGSASVFGIRPTSAGEITIGLQASADNTNASKFVYLGVLQIQSVPEPTTAALFAGGGLLLMLNKRRRNGVA